MTSSPVDLFSEPTSYTDAVLLVEGRKMHVNKALLSHYSELFNTLFNSTYAGIAQPEIPIDGVRHEDFAFFLGMIHREKPVQPTYAMAETLLYFASQFKMPNVTNQVENYLLKRSWSSKMKIFVADKFHLERLLEMGIEGLYKRKMIDRVALKPEYKNLREKTKVQIFEKLLNLRDVDPGVGRIERDEPYVSSSDDSDEDEDCSDEENSDEESSDEE